MSWAPYSGERLLFAGRDLLVCEWRCNGAKKPWFQEQTRYDELELPRRGVHLRAIGRQRDVIDPTAAAFSGANDEYARASPARWPQTSTLLVVRGDLANALIPRDSPRARRISPDAATLHLRLLRAQDPVAVEETAIALIGRVLVPTGPDLAATKRAEGSGNVSPSWRRLSQEIQHVIATRFDERLTLETMAALCKTSPFHASRVFRAVTGETIHRHLMQVRLRVALFELQRGDGRLTDIALSTGFSSHSHFTSVFRTEFGCAPSNFVGPAKLSQRTIKIG